MRNWVAASQLHQLRCTVLKIVVLIIWIDELLCIAVDAALAPEVCGGILLKKNKKTDPLALRYSHPVWKKLIANQQFKNASGVLRPQTALLWWEMSRAPVFKNHNRLDQFTKYVLHCPAICQIEVVANKKKVYFSFYKPKSHDVSEVAPVILRSSLSSVVKGQAVEFDNMFVWRLMAQGNRPIRRPRDVLFLRLVYLGASMYVCARTNARVCAF